MTTTDPDYGAVQATLCVNLMRRGVIDQIIPREELAEWAQVLSDIACKPLQEKIAQQQTALQTLHDGLAWDWRGRPVGDLPTLRAVAKSELKGEAK